MIVVVRIEKNHKVRCSHVDLVKKYRPVRYEEQRCRKRAIIDPYRGDEEDDYCLEHFIHHNFNESDTLSYYCEECPDDAEPIVVFSKILSIKHGGVFHTVGFAGDTSEYHLCKKHQGIFESIFDTHPMAKECAVFIRSDCR